MKKLFTFFAALGLALTTQAANIAVSGLQFCDAYYWTYEDEESGSSIGAGRWCCCTATDRARKHRYQDAPQRTTLHPTR